VTAAPPDRGGGQPRRDYSRVRLDDAQIAAGQYKNFLGGKAEQWDRRGAFQLALLRWLGLQPGESLLDVGCGPIRGGVHFIRFLDPGGYAGVDYNASFVAAAQGLVAADPALAAKSPQLTRLPAFELDTLGRTFDRLLCFSVLNHCDEPMRARFFANVPAAMHAGSRLLVTHAAWFDPARLDGTALRVERAFADEAALPAELRLADWGFDGPGDRLPIVELMRR
jgi:SAM-dependent methyltransferase